MTAIIASCVLLAEAGAPTALMYHDASGTVARVGVDQVDSTHAGGRSAPEPDAGMGGDADA